MEYQVESYPDQIRRIAVDMTQMQNWYELNHAAEKLQTIANKIEGILEQSPPTVAENDAQGLWRILWGKRAASD